MGYHLEYGGSIVFQNISILPHRYMASPKRIVINKEEATLEDKKRKE